MKVVVGDRVHCLRERIHNWKVVIFSKGIEMVYIEVVLGSNCVGIVVVLCMVHMVHKVVGMVDKD